MEIENKLNNYLKNLNISYTIHEHPAVFTVAESDRVIKDYSYFHTKNLFMKGESGNFYLICLRADKKLDIKKLRAKLKEGKISFASPEELKKHLNLTPGSVSLFGIINSKKVMLLLDEEIWNAEKVGFHPNINIATLEITHKDLETFYNSLPNKKEIISL